MLSLCGGRGLDSGLVPPVLWTLFVLQGAVLWGCVRLLRRDQTPVWILVLPAVSQTWLFRATELRAMQLAILFLMPLLTITVARARGARIAPWWLSVCTAGFAYAHGAVEVAPMLWLLGACGGRLERGRGTFPWRDGGWVLLGLLPAATLRPDFPANLGLWVVLNAGLVVARASGELRVYPTELLPLSLRDLLAVEWTFLVATGALVAMNVRTAGRRWSLLLPVGCLVLAALASRRLLEIAAPFVLLAMAVTCPWRPRLWFTATLFVLACLVHLPMAGEGAERHRVRELQPVAEWLRQRARPDDLVFVTDWAASSPLAWFTRDTGLRFSGAIDPVFMWAAHPDLWHEWQLVKEARASDPIQVVRKVFGARFLVFAVTDAPASLPWGATADAIRTAMQALPAGVIVDVFATYPISRRTCATGSQWNSRAPDTAW